MRFRFRWASRSSFFLRLLRSRDFLPEQLRAVGVQYVAVNQAVKFGSDNSSCLPSGAGDRKQPYAATTCGAADDWTVGSNKELHFRKPLEEPVANASLPCWMKMRVDFVNCDYTRKGDPSLGRVNSMKGLLGSECPKHQAHQLQREAEDRAIAVAHFLDRDICAVAIDNLQSFGGNASDVCSVRQQSRIVDEGDHGVLYRFRFLILLELFDLKLLKPEKALPERNVLSERREVWRQPRVRHEESVHLAIAPGESAKRSERCREPSETVSPDGSPGIVVGVLNLRPVTVLLASFRFG